MARCWDAGRDGRLLLDRICDGVAEDLAPGGVLLLVQSELSSAAATLARLGEAGLEAAVVAQDRIPFGPVLRSRSDMLRSRGLLLPDQHDEQLLTIEARHAGSSTFGADEH